MRTSSTRRLSSEELARRQPCALPLAAEKLPPLLDALLASPPAPTLMPHADLPDGAIFLPSFDDEDDALMDLPDIGFDGFLRDNLGLTEQQVTYPAADAQLPGQPVSKYSMQSMSSLDSATSSTGHEAGGAKLQSPMFPDASGVQLDGDAADMYMPETLSEREPSSDPDDAKDASGPDSAEQQQPMPCERNRRNRSTAVTRLAKQREKNRRCQRSFRERQKVKQEALMTELQELRDRCSSLESELAKARKSSSK